MTPDPLRLAPDPAPMSASAARHESAAGIDLPAVDVVRRPVTDLLTRFLERRARELTGIAPELGELTVEVESLVAAGGKRLRPAFVYWGHEAAGGGSDPEVVVRVAAAVELLHTFALLHDDVMDRSPRRRGRPTAHVSLAGAHQRAGLGGDPDWFGVAGGILAGDLAFVLADELLAGAGLAAAVSPAVHQAYNLLRIEVTAGQYLDLRLANHPRPTSVTALQVALLKSGRYSITRPLQVGMALAGGERPELGAALAAYGDAVGVAFQLRDDVLGLFGDPAETGKGALDDLREGKRTLLVVLALERSRGRQRRLLEDGLGRPELDETTAEAMREVIVESGALDAVERQVSERRAEALDALDGIEELPRAARDALAELASLAAFRLR